MFSDCKSTIFSPFPTFFIYISQRSVSLYHTASALPGVLLCDICPCVGRTASSPLTWTAACRTLSVSPRPSPVSPCPPSTSSSRTGSWRSGAGGPLLPWTSQLCRRTNPHKPPKLPDLVTRKFLFKVQPRIFMSDHKETLAQKPRPLVHQCPLMEELASPALCHLPTVWGIVLLTVSPTLVQPLPPNPPRCYPLWFLVFVSRQCYLLEWCYYHSI